MSIHLACLLQKVVLQHDVDSFGLLTSKNGIPATLDRALRNPDGALIWSSDVKGHDRVCAAILGPFPHLLKT